VSQLKGSLQGADIRFHVQQQEERLNYEGSCLLDWLETAVQCTAIRREHEPESARSSRSTNIGANMVYGTAHKGNHRYKREAPLKQKEQQEEQP
jgi:ribonuclease PH